MLLVGEKDDMKDKRDQGVKQRRGINRGTDRGRGEEKWGTAVEQQDK